VLCLLPLPRRRRPTGSTARLPAVRFTGLCDIGVAKSGDVLVVFKPRDFGPDTDFDFADVHVFDASSRVRCALRHCGGVQRGTGTGAVV
jgi:hypothetical protein